MYDFGDAFSTALIASTSAIIAAHYVQANTTKVLMCGILALVGYFLGTIIAQWIKNGE